MKKPAKTKPLLGHEPPIRSKQIRKRDPAQPNLMLDPMPARIEPCLALLKNVPPTGDDWLLEVKWDGYRLAVHIELTGVRIITRGGHDWTHRFPTIKAAAERLPVATAIIDGEGVVLDQEGRSDFGKLQTALGGRNGKASSADVSFMAFDLLYFDGHDLTNVELSSRRTMLEDLIDADNHGIRFSESIDGDSAVLLATACQLGLEGIIAKHRDSAYRSGRTGDWLKIKCIQSDSFFIVGYEPSTSTRGSVGSLVLAAWKGNNYEYVGSVGTGFTAVAARYLRTTLDKLSTKSPPFPTLGHSKTTIWCEPTLIAEIEYRGFTGDGKLRHAAYKGLRDVQDNAGVYRID